MKNTKKLALMLSLVLAATSMTACSGNKTNGGIAAYGKEAIPVGEAEFLLRYEQWMSEAYYWDLYTYMGYDNMWQLSSDGTTTYGDSVHTNVMSEILQTRVLMDHASEYGIEALTAEQQTKVEEMVDSLLESYPAFAEHVSATRDEMVSYMEKNAIASLVIEAVKDAANVEASEDEYQMYGIEYIKVSEPEEEEESTEEAAEEETAAAEEETEEPALEGMELAGTILERANAGEAFDDIAADYDDATSNTATYLLNGETSTAETYTATKDMKVGDISIVEVSGEGWYIVKRVSDLDEEASESKRQSVIDEKRSAAFEEVYTEWAKSAEQFTVDETKWAEYTITEKIYEAPETETEAAAEEAETETEAAQ